MTNTHINAYIAFVDDNDTSHIAHLHLAQWRQSDSYCLPLAGLTLSEMQGWNIFYERDDDWDDHHSEGDMLVAELVAILSDDSCLEYGYDLNLKYT